MRFTLFFPLIVLALGTASASSTAFSIEPGDCEVFFVSGSNPPTIDVEQGELESQSVLLIPPNLWRVELCCADESPTTCEGWIRS